MKLDWCKDGWTAKKNQDVWETEKELHKRRNSIMAYDIVIENMNKPSFNGFCIWDSLNNIKKEES